MISLRRSALALVPGLLMISALLAPATLMADADDPPTRVARLAYLEGSISFQPGGTDEWVEAPLNRPVTTGDIVWSDQGSRAELQLDGSALRLSSNTAVSFLNLSDNVSQVQLSVGTLLVRVRRLDDNETYEIDTPNLAFSVLQPGVYRVTVDESGTTTAIAVRSGQGEVTGAGAAYTVYANENDVFSGTDDLVENAQPYGSDQDSFDAWSRGRDSRWDNSVSARYVSSDVVGYEDLDGQGAWESTPEYGNVWFPRGVEAGWAPYHDGHWSYIEPWGYTWVDDQRWGFAPFHYGRWISVRGAWGWVPCPPRATGVEYVRPVYAPALVAWVGVGAGVAWFALGPREVFVPSYPVSRRYVNNINVSNTTVNTTVINNVYNTTIIDNKTINVTNVNYANRNVPGAVAATTSQAFTTAQPVARNSVHVDAREIVSAQVRAVTPAVVPTKQSVLGGARSAAARPSAIVQTRTVVARVAPPAPPPVFERRQEAIKANGGKPLSVGAVRSLPGQPAVAAAVKLAPPAMPAAVRPPERPAPSAPTKTPPVSARTEPVRPPERPAPSAPAKTPPVSARTEPARPPSAPSEGTRPAPVAVHPQELPQVFHPASPAAANTALERQHLQEQQQLLAQQAAERQRVQQQQERDHAQLAKQQADDAKKQQLEQQQRQQQAQQLAQQHAQELQQQAKQQADDARRQQLEQQQREQQAQQLAQQHAQELQQQQARQQAEAASRQQLEQQHQQQTQQLAQQHAQALQQQQEQQQEQRRQLEAQAQAQAQAQSRKPKAAPPPNQKP